MTAGETMPSHPRLIAEIVHDGGSWSWLRDSAETTGSVTAALAEAARLPSPVCKSTIVLGTDALVRGLNRDWRRQDKPTNVLSFPSPSPPSRRACVPAELFIGDVVLAEETILREATEEGKAASDHFRHLVLHGLLHLLGFDHETPEDARRMEALETQVLAGLGIADPYADTEPVAGS